MLHDRKQIHVRSPLRVSFIGGGTDFEDYYARKGRGHVISMAVNVFMYVTIKDMFDHNVRVHHELIETQASSSRIQHRLARETLENYDLLRGIETIITSDILTSGSGMGASSSLVCALIKGASLFSGGVDIKEKALAEKAYDLENSAGIVGGKQDQYATAYGGFNSIVFEKKSVHVSKTKMSQKNMNKLLDCCFLVYTNMTRESLNIQKTLRKAIVGKRKDKYLDRLLEMSSEFKQLIAVKRVDIKKIGKIVHDSWRIKKIVSPQSTNRHIDQLYGHLHSRGVCGGKMLGAGGGGFMLAIAKNPATKKKIVRDLYPRYYCMDIGMHKKGTEVLWKNF